ncbi:uncharacterized protein LOC124675127 [Lolium rigidum]|uniref:uncharacterized protein LOC124675127 n=1 Tax=Lolium rigidum TaxID=89674 RepID=UPI001F5D1010|nr:uncharacterized protein LOC124675127 [Lolium rigidum]
MQGRGRVLPATGVNLQRIPSSTCRGSNFRCSSSPMADLMSPPLLCLPYAHIVLLAPSMSGCHAGGRRPIGEVGYLPRRLLRHRIRVLLMSCPSSLLHVLHLSAVRMHGVVLGDSLLGQFDFSSAFSWSEGRFQADPSSGNLRE